MADALLQIWPEEACGKDGYPLAWHRCPNCVDGLIDGLSGKPPSNPCPLCDGAGSIKQMIRQRAGDRCVRCLHPFKVGESGEWEEGTPDDAIVHAEGISAPAFAFPELDEVERGPQGRGNVPLGRVRVLWSDCDEQCRHLGPMRAETTPGPWTPYKPATPDVVGPAVAAIAPARMQAAWRILTVHHLNEVKRDCRWHNLAALCQRCHLYIQRKVTMEQLYPYEHSEWFKPYAAAFYASTYLGEELTRDQTMARLDELLALERMDADGGHTD
jgi:hypothetical protein